MTDLEKKLSEPAILELIAEEASELSHATLKMARVIRGENPTPVSLKRATAMVYEEIADMLVTLKMAEAYEFYDASAVSLVMEYKNERMKERLGLSEEEP